MPALTPGAQVVAALSAARGRYQSAAGSTGGGSMGGATVTVAVTGGQVFDLPFLFVTVTVQG